MFLVLSGTLDIQLRDRDVIMKPRAVCVAPRGLEYCPKADEQVGVMLSEPKDLVNSSTGDSDRAECYEACQTDGLAT